METMQTIIPILRYSDARGAIQWLCATFGFVDIFSVPESGHGVRHAQLKLGTNVIMLGSVRPDDGLTSPQLAGIATEHATVCKREIRQTDPGSRRQPDIPSRHYPASPPR